MREWSGMFKEGEKIGRKSGAGTDIYECHGRI
jgi:hypothetical protein